MIEGFGRSDFSFPGKIHFVFLVSPFLVYDAELTPCAPSQERGEENPIWFVTAQTLL